MHTCSSRNGDTATSHANQPKRRGLASALSSLESLGAGEHCIQGGAGRRPGGRRPVWWRKVRPGTDNVTRNTANGLYS
eukprot:4557205-Prymnesium_polylepis.1